MDLVLFNSHDTVLLITLYQCALLLLASLFKLSSNPRLPIFAGLFFLSCGAIPLDKLIRFGAEFHPWAVEHLPQSLYLLEMGYWLQGPLLLWTVRSFLDAEYRPRARDAIYLLPFMLFLLHQVLAYYNYHETAPVNADEAPDGADLMTIYFIVLCRELLRLYFAALAATELLSYLPLFGYKNNYQVDRDVNVKRSFGLGSRRSNQRVVQFLVLGTLLLWGVGCVVSFGLIINIKFATNFPVDFLGLSANYINCVLFGGVLVIGFNGLNRPQAEHLDDSNASDRLPSELQIREPREEVPVEREEAPAPRVNPEYVRKLDLLMETEQVYLDANLTLENLAGRIGVSPRTLSTVLNRHYKCNFFEFINRYRIDEAKRLMVAESTRDATMIEVMTAAGFNSKATFNSFFKKIEGVTPRQFKKQQLSS